MRIWLGREIVGAGLPPLAVHVENSIMQISAFMIEVSLTDYWERRNLIYQIFRKMFIFRDKMGKFNFPFVAL